MESTRKGVECCFGTLKDRFRVLKSVVLYHDVDLKSDMFVTFCVLHNTLHIWNGLDALKSGTDSD